MPSFNPSVKSSRLTTTATISPLSPSVKLLEKKENTSEVDDFLMEPMLSDYEKEQPMITPRKGMPRSLSENVLAKADQLFAVNWNSLANLKAHVVKGKLEASDSEESINEESVWEISSTDSLMNSENKMSSAPCLPASEHELYQMFDVGNTFLQFDSLWSGIIEKQQMDTKNAEKKKSAHNCCFKSHQIRKKCPKRKMIEDLKSQLEKAHNHINSLTTLVDKFRHENTELKMEKSRMTSDFQDAIDELVTDVVRLEDELTVKNVTVWELWEELQVALEASRQRRKMLRDLRKGERYVKRKSREEADCPPRNEEAKSLTSCSIVKKRKMSSRRAPLLTQRLT